MSKDYHHDHTQYIHNGLSHASVALNNIRTLFHADLLSYQQTQRKATKQKKRRNSAANACTFVISQLTPSNSEFRQIQHERNTPDISCRSAQFNTAKFFLPNIPRRNSDDQKS